MVMNHYGIIPSFCMIITPKMLVDDYKLVVISG
jgi:hypothetical protein